MIYRQYIIRPATNKDVPVVKSIIGQVLVEYGLMPDNTGKDKDLNDIESNYFTPNGFFGVAVDAITNEVVGTFGLMPTGNNEIELRKMYLLKQARGKGLGRFILTTAIDICRQKNYIAVTLETISPLKEAIALYRQFGFIEITPKQINARVDQAFKLML